MILLLVSTTVGSATITNGHADDAEGNDSDGDGDTLTITNFAAGSTEEAKDLVQQVVKLQEHMVH